jgi:hypothetical protein
MPITVREPESKFQPAPEGLWPAVCVDVIDKGEQETPWGRKAKVELRWQIDEANPDTGKRYEVRAWYTASLSEKAKLRQVLETWRARKFTADELKGFDLEAVLGANCQIQIVHNASDEGKVFANVQAVVPASRGAIKLAPLDYVREQDRVGHAASASADESVDAIPF